MRWMPVLLLTCASCLPAWQGDADVDNYSDTARRALAAKDWQVAVQALEHLARVEPEAPEVHANLGLAYYFEGRAAEALASFERARKLKPQLAEVDAMIGLAQAELGRCRKAVPALALSFARSSDRETSRLSGLHLLHCYAQVQEHAKAATVAETLLARFPNDAEILYQVSRFHAERSADLMAALFRTAPDSAWMHYANAQVQESLDRSNAAAQEYRHALEKDPRMPGVHYKLGRLLLSGSRTPETLQQAREEFQQELALSPANADAEYELGEMDREQNQFPAALAHLERAIQDHPDFTEARIAIGKLLVATGQTEAALPHLREAERLDPQNTVPHYLLASAYKTLGKSDQAATEFAEYRKLEGNKSPTASSQIPSSNRP